MDIEGIGIYVLSRQVVGQSVSRTKQMPEAGRLERKHSLIEKFRTPLSKPKGR